MGQNQLLVGGFIETIKNRLSLSDSIMFEEVHILIK